MLSWLPKRVTGGQARVVIALSMSLPVAAYAVRVTRDDAPHNRPDPRLTMDKAQGGIDPTK
jgi:hypothetical protein